ncbi:MAG TPA: RNA polymerase sigma factor [Streptosporangiaceae bacterium]|jgi:RNA polymerase sigma-70 factor (ECF subfamily)
MQIRTDQPDATLIAESGAEPERFGLVFDRHAPVIYGYIARRLGRDVADDLVAETFLIAFRQRAGYDPGQPDARPWLYGIATRLISRHRRGEVRFFRAIARTGVDPAAGPADDEALRRASAQAVRRDLSAALAALPAADRDALLLFTEGLAYAEVAAALGVPVGTVSSRIARARRKIKHALGGVNPAEATDDEGTVEDIDG